MDTATTAPMPSPASRASMSASLISAGVRIEEDEHSAGCTGDFLIKGYAGGFSPFGSLGDLVWRQNWRPQYHAMDWRTTVLACTCSLLPRLDRLALLQVSVALAYLHACLGANAWLASCKCVLT
jgi:hypothetical protein